MNDLEFVRRCIDGDKQARDEFLSLYSRLIYNYIYHVLKSKGCKSDPGQVDDIFQELFRSLIDDDCKKLKSFKARNNASLASWLRQVTINFVLDHLRTTRHMESLEAEDEQGFALKDVIPAENVPAADIAHNKEIYARLKECIDKLSLDDKYFVELHFNRKLRLDDLMKLFGVSRGAMDMRRQRLLRSLRECFSSKGIELDL
ncbi:MAG: sigma-70 family RNA polymerase sigma factor [Candidatus Omnitrophica bacterium]|nr:sigma-70 family RNA polymerase sigma factor [Candidatus Omnitrophota bacterium]